MPLCTSIIALPILWILHYNCFFSLFPEVLHINLGQNMIFIYILSYYQGVWHITGAQKGSVEWKKEILESIMVIYCLYRQGPVNANIYIRKPSGKLFLSSLDYLLNFWLFHTPRCISSYLWEKFLQVKHLWFIFNLIYRQVIKRTFSEQCFRSWS